MLDNGYSSRPGSVISLGTAEARPMSRPILVDHSNRTSRSIPTTLMDFERSVSPAKSSGSGRVLPNVPQLSPIQPPPGLFDLPPLSPASRNTIEDLRRTPASATKRRSIIDPASVRLSFAGSVSDLSSPIGFPVEEGLQRLYEVYEQNTDNPIMLPRAVQITEVPFTTIADCLQTRFQEQQDAIIDCAGQMKLTANKLEATKQELVHMENLYALAVQEANLKALSSDELRLRLEWHKDEIARINFEKEHAMKQLWEQKRESTMLYRDLETMSDFIEENSALKERNAQLEQRQYELEKTVADLRMQVETSKFVLKSVPSPIQKMCYKLLVPKDARESKEGKTGYLFDDSLAPALRVH